MALHARQPFRGGGRRGHRPGGRARRRTPVRPQGVRRAPRARDRRRRGAPETGGGEGGLTMREKGLFSTGKTPSEALRNVYIRFLSLKRRDGIAPDGMQAHGAACLLVATSLTWGSTQCT